MSKIKFKRGIRTDLPNLDYGEPAFVSDEQELYIGGIDENIKITHKKEIEELTSQLNVCEKKVDDHIKNCSSITTPNITIGTVTTLEPGQQATVTKKGTAENPIFDFGIPKGETVVQKIDAVTTNIVNNRLDLTTDKIQTTTMINNTSIILPNVDSFTEIHLFFNTTEELTLIFPEIKWQNIPNIDANKTYEFIFTYVNNTWMGGYIPYE